MVAVQMVVITPAPIQAAPTTLQVQVPVGLSACGAVMVRHPNLPGDVTSG